MMSTQLVTSSREELRERWQQAKMAYPAIALSAHQALRAIQFEEKAEGTLASVVPSNALDAYKLCDALADLSRALEAWVYVSARLWYLCETGQANAEIKVLHTNSTEQYMRILAAHLQTQELTFAFCQQQQIVLRFGVITQALDVGSKGHHNGTKTGVSLREKGGK
jgi:hypothetical protein